LRSSPAQWPGPPQTSGAGGQGRACDRFFFVVFFVFVFVFFLSRAGVIFHPPHNPHLSPKVPESTVVDTAPVAPPIHTVRVSSALAPVTSCRPATYSSGPLSMTAARSEATGECRGRRGGYGQPSGRGPRQVGGGASCTLVSESMLLLALEMWHSPPSHC
jgi:hypothetical protein